MDKSLYSTLSATSADVVRALHREGPEGFISKVDWADAYKHIPVRLPDIGLQVFKLANRYFCDRGLSFGGTTSPPLFDDPAELAAQMSHWEANVSRYKSIRQLDDLCSAGTWEEVMAVYNATRSVADFTGIHLASENDAEKAFSPTKSGIILGITYSVEDFTWRLAPSKVDKMANLLFDVLENDSLPNGTLKTLLGKLNHYMGVFGTKFERTFIQKCHIDSAPKFQLVPISANAKSQAGHWLREITRAEEFNPIPYYKTVTSPSPYVIHADASGGNSGGFGALMELPDGNTLWSLGSWGKREDPTLTAKLTFLEAFASLSGLLLGPDLIRNEHVQVLYYL